MKIALICLSLLMIAAPCQLTAQEDGFKVLTYNIRYLNNNDGQDIWANRREAVCKVISATDVAGLQEVVAEQYSQIRERTPELEWYGVGRDDGQQQGEMTPIGWRKSRFEAQQRGTFWLSENPEAVGTPGWDAALPRIASWVQLRDRASGAEYLFVNTHFDHRGPQARENSGKLLRQWIAEHREGRRAILTGDLNAQVTDLPLKALLDPSPSSPPLTDARRVAKQADSGPDSTWNGFREIAVGRRIDFILLAGDFQVAQVTTLDPRTEAGRFASDHLPVLAELK
jgi:endonuclease/exonuclease/phosphatase family metal-dependent hydrolase